MPRVAVRGVAAGLRARRACRRAPPPASRRWTLPPAACCPPTRSSCSSGTLSLPWRLPGATLAPCPLLPQPPSPARAHGAQIAQGVVPGPAAGAHRARHGVLPQGHAPHGHARVPRRSRPGRKVARAAGRLQVSGGAAAVLLLLPPAGLARSKVDRRSERASGRCFCRAGTSTWCRRRRTARSAARARCATAGRRRASSC